MIKYVKDDFKRSWRGLNEICGKEVSIMIAIFVYILLLPVAIVLIPVAIGIRLYMRRLAKKYVENEEWS